MSNCQLVLNISIYNKKLKKEVPTQETSFYELKSNYLTAFLKDFPGTNPGNLRADSVIRSPVFGFLPGLAARLRTVKVPNPVSTTFSPRFSESLMQFKNEFTASLEALLVKFAFFATTSMVSLLVKIHHLPQFGYISI